VACTTPISVGTPIVQKIRPDTEKPRKLDKSTYEEYIIQDLEHRRVFIDIEVFMKYVLRVPDDWEERWGPIIERIKRNTSFLAAHEDFTAQCDAQGVHEKKLYQPLVNMNNEILDESSKDELVKPAFGLQYLVNDPKPVLQGVMNNLVPDVVAVHKEFVAHLDPTELKERRLKKTNLTWAHAIQALEFKPLDGALVDGSHMPRLKVGGKSSATFGSKIGLLTRSRTRPAKKPCSTPFAVEVLEGHSCRNYSPTRSGGEGCRFGSRGTFTSKAASRRVAGIEQKGKKAACRVVPWCSRSSESEKFAQQNQDG